MYMDRGLVLEKKRDTTRESRKQSEDIEFYMERRE